MTGNDMLKAGVAALALLLAGFGSAHPVFAQEQTAAADVSGDTAATSPEPLSADEMEVLVARIALYPDELIAVITAAALYPLEIVEAARFLDRYEKDKSLKPKESWDGSVVSLLNYPDIVKMMSDDLEWTQALGDAIAYQQKDVLVAIQQLRDEAVAKGVIKTDDKIQVTKENDNVVIKSASPEVIYVPQYPPQMLYEPDYVVGADPLLSRPLSVLLVPGRDLLRRGGDGRGLGRRGRLGRLGRVGRPLERQRHQHRLQQLFQQPRLQRQDQLQRCRLEECRPLQDQHRPQPVQQVRPAPTSRTGSKRTATMPSATAPAT